MDLIEKDINDGYDPRDKWSASGRPMLLKRDLPEPISCDTTYCTLDEPPGCLNFEVSADHILVDQSTTTLLMHKSLLNSYPLMVTGERE